MRTLPSASALSHRGQSWKGVWMWVGSSGLQAPICQAGETWRAPHTSLMQRNKKTGHRLLCTVNSSIRHKCAWFNWWHSLASSGLFLEIQKILRPVWSTLAGRGRGRGWREVKVQCLRNPGRRQVTDHVMLLLSSQVLSHASHGPRTLCMLSHRCKPVLSVKGCKPCSDSQDDAL